MTEFNKDKFSEGMKELRKEFQKKKLNNKKNLINPIKNPRYDDIYYEGLKWLNSL